MFKRLFKKNSLLFILLFLFVFQSCKTTRSLAKESLEPNAPEEAHVIVAHDVVFPDDIEENYKYIFFRLYNPSYRSPFYIANILKNGLKLTKTEKVPDLSHASINFTLDDNFYGLTLGGEYQFAEETCIIPQNNKYMKHCDPTKSEQITYALKVSEEEYERTKNFIEYYINSTDIKYASGLNFKLAIFSLRRKFFTTKEHNKFGSINYPRGSDNKKVDIEEDEDLPTNFVCSTFLGYVLYNNVDSVTEFFDENNVKYEYMNVTDISLIPGITPLFYSTWDNYVEAAKEFVAKYPEFAEYLTQ